MKSKKIYKSIVAIALARVMLVMRMGAGYSENKVVYTSDSEINFDELVAVVVFETEDGVLTAYVPLDKVAEYTNRLENEIGYRESQIAMVQSNHRESTENGILRCPPPSSNSYHLSSKNIMDIDAIRANIEAGENNLDEFNRLLFLGDAVGALSIFKKFAKFGYVGTISFIMGTISNLLVGAKLRWYNESIEMIISGEITVICHCVYINTGSDYPKAWNY